MSQQRATYSSELVLGSSELAKILTYPQESDNEYAARLKELDALGVTGIFGGGRTTIGGTSIAGKGCVGLVVKAKAHGRLYALKIRRTDANRPTMREEVKYHKLANDAGVGPKLVDCSDNFILMEFAEGVTIAEWAKDKANVRQASSVAMSALEQCYLLDRVSLDHGELSHVDRHIIVDDAKATVIDFESASTQRKPSNVTAAGQSLFVSGVVSGLFSQALPYKKESAISALKKYKHDQTRENFEAIFELLS